jgi:hypothetical protein
MHVAWVTVGERQTSTTFRWGVSGTSLTNVGNATAYDYRTGMATPIMLMDGTMTGLLPNTQYFYTVGDASYVFNFTNQPVRAGGKVYALLADFGLANDVSLQQLKTEAANNRFDAVIHAGDFGMCMHVCGLLASVSLAAARCSQCRARLVGALVARPGRCGVGGGGRVRLRVQG